MKLKKINFWPAIIAMIAFWISTIIYAWKLIDEGARMILVLPVILFSIAATLWTINVINVNKRRKD